MDKFDIIIIGGGLTSVSLAHLLPKSLKIAIVDFKSITEPYHGRDDGRNIAISAASVKLLDKSGLWGDLEPLSSPIKHMIVNDNYSSPILHFDANIIGEKDCFIGKMVMADDLIKSFQKNINKKENVTIFAPYNFTAISYKDNFIIASLERDGQKLQIKSSLMIGADGKNSSLRKLSNIKSFSKSYNQNAVVFNLEHEKDHQNIAHEIFLPTGPLAILPLHSKFQSSIVLSQESNIANNMIASEDLLREIMQEKCHFLGQVRIISEVISYPLTLSYSNKYVENRIALIGDAIHSIHPIAGQGFNLGLQDVKEIACLIEKNHGLGIDLGDSVLLSSYEKNRKIDNKNMILITDTFNWLFSNNSTILKKARRFGLKAVSKMDFLKRHFMKYASRDL